MGRRLRVRFSILRRVERRVIQRGRRGRGSQALLAAAFIAIVAAGPAARAASTPASDGTIAYIASDRASVHLVAPDGTNDRVAWSVPSGTVYGIQDVKWSPDGSHLAISSGHEALCSVFQYDLYTLLPDGTDLRRVTNTPACDELGSYPTGGVTVTVDNPGLADQLVFVYVDGAPEAQYTTVASGFETTVQFPSVADFGAGVPQYVVVSDGDKRWYSPASSADVLPGKTVTAAPLDIGGEPITTFGAVTVTWSADGSTLGYQFGQGALWRTAAEPGAGAGAQPLFDLPSGVSVLGNDLAWSPTGDQVLYERFDTDPWAVTLGTVGATDPGKAIVTVNLSHGISWLPDGSGFVVSASDSLLSSADLYLVDIATSHVTRLTAEESAFAYWPSVSVDGSQVAYTRFEGSSSAPTNIELHVTDLSGGGDMVIAQDAIAPAWGRASMP